MQKQYRLKGERNFKIVFKRGISVSGRHLVLLTMRSRNAEITKFGLTVGKKVGNAVKRNLVKRRLRSIITELLPDIRQGYIYVLIAKGGVDTVLYRDLYAEVKKLFGRVNYQ